MSATDELRRMLDEAGVEWRGGLPTETIVKEPIDALYVERSDGRMHVYFRSYLTPAQAVAATLGRGTCRLHDCDGSFSSVNRPVWRCDCGAFMTHYTDATTYHKPRFCPNCGRRCVG